MVDGALPHTPFQSEAEHKSLATSDIAHYSLLINHFYSVKTLIDILNERIDYYGKKNRMSGYAACRRTGQQTGYPY